MHAFRHPASRRAYGAALSEADKAQIRKDAASGKSSTASSKYAPVIAESIRTGVPYEELVAGGGATAAAPADAQTVSEDMAPPTGGSSFPWVWVVGGAVLLGSVGFAAWYFTRPKPEAAFVPSPTV